ncbi:polyadenylation and cleavage factor homolog 4 isoform X3 [Lathyrus oleraceus]|uniref:polyadenylation and cleavage factor homolog 4 isoform X3 n=1 Tax=Pisum sativum TaxID=3888 RepID=UPI0021D1EF3A|nr:polyadenylation and cleavage factor homolog 4 isoform X3 [Pisum sativum]
MEGTRRLLDRSREPGPKKPRLMEELQRGSNPNTRPFPQRPPATMARFRINDRELDTSDADHGDGGYHPQPPPHQELVTQYRAALAELTFNSKPIITNLTIIAGENLSAAKSIAGAVCANILEVSSDQKLPSLYLLDSIVKNIGRDYIKYFAVRLPEVFCNTYKHVDPPVHSSMRHLFGTWRGVFPPQTLQIIEKELGFAPTVNGSASASATIRNDSQSQRPPHSIHVNPKYLERQRLQQSSKTKGVFDDMTGVISNANEDSERSNRALGVARPWLDSRVNMRVCENNQHTHRDAFNDSVPDKSIDGAYGDEEYNSSVSNNLGSDVGRTGSRLIGGVAETLSGQRNGFSLKHGFSNYEAPKPMNLDAHNIRSSARSRNWKNSEEEEFVWDEMNPGLPEHVPNVSSNLSSDPWIADDDNLESEDHLQMTHPIRTKVDKEISTVKKQLPSSGGHSSLSWGLQKQLPSAKFNMKSGHSETFVSAPSGLPKNSNSLAARMRSQSSMPHTTIGSAKIMGQQQFDSEGAESPSEQSPLQQQSPSVPVTTHHAPSVRNLAEQDCSQTLKTSQHLGGPQSQYIKDPTLATRPNVPVGTLRKSQAKDTRGPSSSVTSVQAKPQQRQLGPSQVEVTLKAKQPLKSRVSLAKAKAKETSEKSTTKSHPAPSVKSGVIPNKSGPITKSLDASNRPSQSGVKPTRSIGASPTTLISSGSSSVSLGSSNDHSQALPKLPQGKVVKKQKKSTQPSASSNERGASAPSSNTVNKNTLNPISNLLSSLVAKGLISAGTESATVVPNETVIRSKDQTESITTSSSLPVVSVLDSATVPIKSSKVEVDGDEVDDDEVDGDEVDDAAKASLALSQSTSTEIINLIGFDFKPDVIREMHPHVITKLLDELPHHCSKCGIRLKHPEQFDRHLEWHATKEREQNGVNGASRRWYAKSNDWIAGKAGYLSESEFTDSVDELDDENIYESQLDSMVLADENQCLCVLCGELFEDVYCQEREQWMFKGAVYLNNSDNISEMESRNVGPIIHARCLSENKISVVTNTELD